MYQIRDEKKGREREKLRKKRICLHKHCDKQVRQNTVFSGFICGEMHFLRLREN